jgi:excisionase family DNA binding protein
VDQLLVPIVPGVTDALGISRRAVYTLIDGGQLQRVKIGRRALVTADLLNAYVARLVEAAAS